MAGLLSWLGDRAKDVGRAIGTVADAVVPGNQSNWHLPAQKTAPPPRPQVQRQSPINQLMNSPLVRYNPINPMASLNMFNDVTKTRIPGLGVSTQDIAAQIPSATKQVITGIPKVGMDLDKAFVKPFWETGDFLQQSGQIGVSNVLDAAGMKGARENADILRKQRDESFQQGFARPASVVYHAADQLNPVSMIERQGEENAINSEIDLRNKQATEARNRLLQDTLSGKISKEQYKEASDQLMAWQSEPSQKLQGVYQKRIQDLGGINADGSQKKPLNAGLSAAGDFLTLYTLGRAPVSGSGLTAAAAEAGTTVAKKAAQEIALSNVLNTISQVASGVGNGQKWQDIAKNTAMSSALNTLLMGAGYLHGAKASTALPSTPKVDADGLIPIPNSNVRIDPKTGQKVFAPNYQPSKAMPGKTGPVNSNFYPRQEGQKFGPKPPAAATPQYKQLSESIQQNVKQRQQILEMNPKMTENHPTIKAIDKNIADMYAQQDAMRGIKPPKTYYDNVSKDILPPNSGNKGFTNKVIDKAVADFEKGKISEQQLRSYIVDHYTAKYGKMPTEADIAALSAGNIKNPAVADLKAKFQKQNSGDPLEALKAEARKYKSADEFVKSQSKNWDWKSTSNVSHNNRMTKDLTDLYNQAHAQPTPKAVAPKGAPIEKTPQPTPDPTAALKQEALKYKSAEEFIATQGKPVYHGTPNKDFTNFDSKLGSSYSDTKSAAIGHWFTNDKNVADQFTHDSIYVNNAKTKNGRVIEAYPNLKKPKVYEPVKDLTTYSNEIDNIKAQIEGLKTEAAATSDWKAKQAILKQQYQLEENSLPKAERLLGLLKRDKNDPYQVFESEVSKYGSPQEYVKAMKEQGYDGVVIKGTGYDANGGVNDQIAVFDSKNIKTKQQLTDLYNQATKPGKLIYETVPKEVSDQMKKQRQTVNTIKSSQTTSKELKSVLTASDYDVLPNRKTMTDAVKIINKNPQAALNEVLSSKPRTTQLNAQALILAERAQKNGDYDLAQQIFKAMEPGNTQAGQTIQILSVWSKTSPEGVVRYAQKVVDDANNVINIKGGNPKYTLSAEKAKLFREVAKEINAMPEGKDKLIATQQLLNAIHQQVPASIGQKLQTATYYTQLLNPKTIVRNIVGNTGMVLSENVKDVIGAPIDAVMTGARRLLGQDVKRSIYMPNPIKQIKAGWQGGKEAFKEAQAGVNLSGLEGQLQIGNQQPAFRGKTGQFLSKTMQSVLSVPDRAFYSARYDQTLRNLMKGEKVKVPTKAMKEIAHHDALVSTFQDDSAAARMFVSLKKGLNIIGLKDPATGEKTFGAGTFIVNYPKTPGNLLARGIDYSPAGFVKSMAQAVKPLVGRGQFDQKAFIDSFTRATTGTAGLIGTGAILHNVGIITGRPDKDKDVNAADKASGLGAYRINMSALKRFVLSGFDPNEAKLRPGDQLANYDWFQPAAIGISMGANLDENKGSKDAFINKMSGMLGKGGESLAEGINTLVEQPLVKNVVKATGYGNLGQGAMSILKDVPAAFVPTIVSQINQLIDNKSRNTYDPSPVQESLNKVKSKIPGLAQTLQPQVGPLGEDNERYQNGGNNMFNVFLNPAFNSTYDPTEIDTEIKRLYDATGESSQYPAIIKNTQKVNGKDVQLTAQQVTDVQRMQGELTKNAFNQVMKSPGYAKLSDSEKVQKLQNIITQANQVARIKVLGDQIDKQTSRAVRSAVKSGEINTSISGSSSTASNPKDRYEEAKAKYEQDLADGAISDVNLSGRQSELKKLEVKSKYSEDASDLYGKSYKEMVNFVNNYKNGKALWDEILKLDADMVNAGYTSKIRDKYGNLKKTTSGGSKGAKAKKPKVIKTSKAITSSIKAIRSGNVRRIGASAAPKYAVKKLPVPKIKSKVA